MEEKKTTDNRKNDVSEDELKKAVRTAQLPKGEALDDTVSLDDVQKAVGGAAIPKGEALDDTVSLADVQKAIGRTTIPKGEALDDTVSLDDVQKAVGREDIPEGEALDDTASLEEAARAVKAVRAGRKSVGQKADYEQEADSTEKAANSASAGSADDSSERADRQSADSDADDEAPEGVEIIDQGDNKKPSSAGAGNDSQGGADDTKKSASEGTAENAGTGREPEAAEDLSAAKTEKSGKKNRRREGTAGAARKILLTLIIVIVALVGAGYGFYHYEFSRMQRENAGDYSSEEVVKRVSEETDDDDSNKAMEKQTKGLQSGEAVAAEGDVFKDDDVYNILLIGTDDRTRKFAADARGDSCILLSLNKKTGKVHLVSFERGIGVPILSGPYKGQYDWLTHTFRYGGAELMTAEIRENFKIDVDRYIRINIQTLIDVINAIGGVDVAMTPKEAEHINHPEGTYTAGYIMGMHVEDDMQVCHAGMNHLNGATAMVYARTRAIDDDWHRMKRQRRIIMAAANKLSKLSTTQMLEVLNDVVPMIQTNLSESEVAELLTLAPKFMGAKVEQMAVPATGTYGVMKGMEGRSLFAVDFNINSKIILSALYGLEAPDMSNYHYSSDSSKGAVTDSSTSSSSSRSSGSRTQSTGSSSSVSAAQSQPSVSEGTADPGNVVDEAQDAQMAQEQSTADSQDAAAQAQQAEGTQNADSSQDTAAQQTVDTSNLTPAEQAQFQQQFLDQYNQQLQAQQAAAAAAAAAQGTGQ
ncbi:MAG: LCP family protein [Lachnospiraceae bacterium]|nr:LCP family protein [Lachnospiraceae bacterium]